MQVEPFAQSGALKTLFANLQNILLSTLLLGSCLTTTAFADEFDDEGYFDDFRLIDQYDTSHALSYFSDYKNVLLIGYQNSCEDLFKDFSKLKVNFDELEKKKELKVFFIDPHWGDDRSEVKVKTDKLFEKPRSVLMDKTQMISYEYGILKSGQFAMIRSSDLKPYFSGNLSSKDCQNAFQNWNEGVFKNKTKCGDTVLESFVTKVGNLFSSKSCDLKIKPTPNINYVDHVAPVIAKNCYVCHYNDVYGSFRGYDQLVGWASMIRQVVRTQRMPPDGRDPYHGNFVGDYNPKDFKPLIEWATRGTLRGKGKDILANLPTSMEPFIKSVGLQQDTSLWLPPMTYGFKDFYSYFKDRKPDVVWLQKEEQVLPPTGVLEYQFLQLAGPTKKDMWVRAVDIKINRRVVHHSNISIIDKPLKETLEDLRKEKSWYTSGAEMLYMPKTKKALAVVKDENGIMKAQEENILLTSKKYVDLPMLFPEGTGAFIPKGKYVIIEYHFVTTGKVERNRASVELYLYKDGEKVKERKRIGFYRRNLFIPPFAKDVVVTNKLVIDRDISILSFKPHFHYRGKQVRFLAKYPDGKEEVLLSIPFYKFKWQPHNQLIKPKFIPKGTEINAEVIYDNSKEFFQNPDPTAWVKIGGQTYTDEMHLPRFSFVEGKLE